MSLSTYNKQEKCKHFNICKLYTEREDGYCILHSPDEDKSIDSFSRHFQNHIKNKGYCCDKFIFPIEIDYSLAALKGYNFENEVSFEECVFLKKVNFSYCLFLKRSNFSKSVFNEGVLFLDTNFCGGANFRSTIFKSYCDFGEAKFHERGEFLSTKFFKRVEFNKAVFNEDVEFRESIFHDGGRFLETQFKGDEISFSSSSILAPTYFSSGRNSDPIFKDAKLLFEEVTINPSDILSFRNVDFRKALFRGTDMRNVELLGVQWAEDKNKKVVYDEVLFGDDKFSEIRYESLEELYRQLKQNYLNRRDYLNAGYFHYGEKEAIRNNPKTSIGIKCLLNLYKMISGYGEKILPAFVCITILITFSTFFYWIGGIDYANNAQFTNDNSINTIDYILYSIESMFFLRSNSFIPISYLTSFITIIQSVISPILLGLLALSIRQRLKR